MARVDQIAEHRDRPEIAESGLIFFAPGRQIPQSAAGVADNRQTRRAQVMQQDLETSEPPQGGSVIISRGDMTRDVPHDAAAGLDDGQRLRLGFVSQSAYKEFERSWSGADGGLVAARVGRQVPQGGEHRFERRLSVRLHRHGDERLDNIGLL